jgi:hypothetical protein
MFVIENGNEVDNIVIMHGENKKYIEKVNRKILLSWVGKRLSRPCA